MHLTWVECLLAYMEKRTMVDMIPPNKMSSPCHVRRPRVFGCTSLFGSVSLLDQSSFVPYQMQGSAQYPAADLTEAETRKSQRYLDWGHHVPADLVLGMVCS
ncbi:hypothetical protein FS749_015291 [Ceratobasidium sp. UAMH 11750]|nr:hypothetical protein FS749_015291 [Ceratobasidium sp. UAMH 11750]